MFLVAIFFCIALLLIVILAWMGFLDVALKAFKPEP